MQCDLLRHLLVTLPNNTSCCTEQNGWQNLNKSSTQTITTVYIYKQSTLSTNR